MSRDHAVLAYEFTGTYQGDRRFFSPGGGDSYSEPAPLQVKEGVGWVALRVHHLILLQSEDPPTESSRREEGLGIEIRIAVLC
jgi:hypothetical protein